MKVEYGNVTKEDVEKQLRLLAKDISGGLPNGWGFALQIFSYGEGGSFFYVSTANREDMIKMLDEWKERLVNEK